METFLRSGALTKYLVSFSRDNTDIPDHIKYVQNNITKHQAEFVKLFLEGDTILYVCGDARNMAIDVNNTVIKAVQDVENLTNSEAKIRVAELMVNKRYLQDIWS